ncbi:MAG TPA: NepR family anti-sigma factor [Sphingopyxis sp.]|nr:NepR family anti-sigma factor [Sphingopyxis sp.]HMQ19163.1 NepR family anti-sigma factor [Sphingopyxis sp.]
MSSKSGSPPDEPSSEAGSSSDELGKGAGKKTRDTTDPLLRRAFERVVDEPIPQPLLDLLNKLS